MSTVDQITNPYLQSMQWQQTAASSTQASEAAGNQALGQEEFLELMTAQLENQDPFKPMENADFIGQMAQFGTVSGIGDLKDSFASFSDTMKSQMLVEASNIVGKSVLTQGDTLAFTPGSDAQAMVKLASNIDSLVVNVQSETGALVRTMRMGAQSEGDVNITWNGENDDGEAMPAGNYTLTVTGTLRGETQGLSPYVYGEVESVSMGNSNTDMVLNVAGVGSKSMEDVVEIAKVGS